MNDVGGDAVIKIFAGPSLGPDATAIILASNQDYVDAEEIVGPERAASFLAGRASSSVPEQIAAALEVRRIVECSRTAPFMSRYVRSLQAGLKASISSSAYADYLATAPVLDPPDVEVMKAEIGSLSARLKLIYASNWMRELYVSEIRTACAGSLLGLLIVILTLLAYQEFFNRSEVFVNTILIGMMGLAGALTSIVARSNALLSQGAPVEDPILQTTAIRSGLSSLTFSALTGTAFAYVMLFVMISGAVSISGLTPEFTTEKVCETFSTVGCVAPDFRLFQYHYAFAAGGATGPAQLFIWAFLAGFAERLVPDVLQRFTGAIAEAKLGKTP